MEWIVFGVLILISIFMFISKGLIGLLFLIPAILFIPPLLDYLYENGVVISDSLRISITVFLCAIGLFGFAKDYIVDYQEKNKDIEVINTMDGLVLQDSELLVLDDGNSNGQTGMGGDGLDTNGMNGQNNPEDGGLWNGKNGFVKYQIKYYYDGQLVESATEEAEGKIGDIIKSYKDKSLGLYELKKTVNYPLELLPADKILEIEIHYTKIKDLVRYKVQYYYGGEIDHSKTKYLDAKEDVVIKKVPMEEKPGYVYIHSAHIPFTVSKTEEHVVKVFYGFDNNTIMEEVGIVDGFAPSILLRKTTETGEQIDVTVCPWCLSEVDLETLKQEGDVYICPKCEEEFVSNKDGKIVIAERNEDGTLKEAKIDNPEQQKITEKWALDTAKKVIHNKLCYAVRQIDTSNFGKSNASINELKALGYTTCKKCNPREEEITD